MAQFFSNFPTASFDRDRYSLPEILQEGIEKQWSYEQQCFVYRLNNQEKKKRKETLESLISYYYKLR